MKQLRFRGRLAFLRTMMQGRGCRPKSGALQKDEGQGGNPEEELRGC